MSTQERTPRSWKPIGAPGVVAGLESFTGRGAGTDAERRAVWWLVDALGVRRGELTIEPFWSRPNWIVAQAGNSALALAGSLVSVASPRAGGGMLLAALVLVIADALTARSPIRWLTRERASQNLIATPRRSQPPSQEEGGANRPHLIITANYDAGRMGLAHRDAVRGAAARLRRALGGITPGWQGWLALGILWLLAVAIARADGHTSAGIGAIQLVPTIGLVLALGLLIELAASDWSPAAGDNGSGVAVALSLARALTTAPPANLDTEVVITGAGDAEGLGLGHHLRARRDTYRPANTIVLGVAACSGGAPRWWTADGSLAPLRFGRRLIALAERVAAEQPHLSARPHGGRGATPALPARRAGIPAITIGCLDERGLVPRSHQPTDTASAVDPNAHDRAVQFGLKLVDAIDAALGETPDAPAPRQNRWTLRRRFRNR